eukprot:CAMPEP_0206023846 /NCGR_PEP_ID=MMETSP1464-20131121/37185_1 /ASSEMBLY_ACC=CAM_ASM_001124 /TAXON_ID=119497 /ORGANISM="Exanthemachrysis gayraliae, Strain RCC1523" /LENGTH=198 /DNA_ID=CAMNT_0053397843 /DNA_START=55 /DNA_END=648 /DNA_ORIENTATION=-
MTRAPHTRGRPAGAGRHRAAARDSPADRRPAPTAPGASLDAGPAAPGGALIAVAVSLEVEVELVHAAVKSVLEAALVREFPLAVHDLESNVLVGRPGVEFNYDGVRGSRGVREQLVLGGLRAVDQVGVEEVELVALHHLGRRVIVVVVRLVVLIPLVARVHAVEIARLARLVLFVPPRLVLLEAVLEGELRLPGLHAT